MPRRPQQRSFPAGPYSHSSSCSQLGTAAEPDLGEAVSLRVEVQYLLGLGLTT
jgi:hypothetical protein